MTYVFIHDIYFIQETALKIDVQLNMIILSPIIPNPIINVYAEVYYKGGDETWNEYFRHAAVVAPIKYVNTRLKMTVTLLCQHLLMWS